MPAMENMKISIMAAIAGLVRDRPVRSPISSTIRPLRCMARITAKVPSVITR